jgi:hypothetical protein
MAPRQHSYTSGRDWCNREAAEQLAREIQLYWLKRGIDFQYEIIVAVNAPASPGGRSTVYGIRSNLKWRVK